MSLRTVSITKSLFVLIALTGLCSRASGEVWYQWKWTRSGFVDQRDIAGGVVTNSAGDIYLAGTTGALHGAPEIDARGALLAKYDSAGNQISVDLAYPPSGGSESDWVYGMAIDAADNMFVTGRTTRSPGGVLLIRYDSTGSQVWKQLLSCPDNEWGYDVTTDALGNAFIAGSTTGLLGQVEGGGYDAFLAKYSQAGDLLWVDQRVESDASSGNTVATDGSGNVYMAGSGILVESSFIAKYDSDGNTVWLQSVNYSAQPDQISHIKGSATDSAGNLYVCGDTNKTWDPMVGYIGGDAVVAKYDPAGNLVWMRQVESDDAEDYDTFGRAVVDADGNVYLVGTTLGDVEGTSAGDYDAFWAKYDSSGNLLWLEQFGTANYDTGRGIAVDALGRVYITGSTQWNANNYYLGESDAYLARFDLVPEPATLSLLALGACLPLFRGKRR